MVTPESLGGFKPDTKPDVFRKWYGMLFLITPCHLTEPWDIFASIASIAQRTHRVLQCRYLAGLWEEDMPRGLMWKAREQHFLPLKGLLSRPLSTGRKPGEAQGVLIVRAPSWSWASVQGPVVWEATRRKEGRYRDPENVVIRPRHQNNRWAAPEVDGKPDRLYTESLDLNIHGRLLPVRISESKVDMDNYINSLPQIQKVWAPRHKKFAVGLKADIPGSSMDRMIFAGGFFDFPAEAKPISLWCLRVVVDEGLLLTREPTGKFKRVGWFPLSHYGRKWYDDFNIDEVALDLM